MPWYRMYMTHSDSSDDAFEDNYFFIDEIISDGDRREYWEQWVRSRYYENVSGDCILVDALPHNAYKDLVNEQHYAIERANSLLSVLMQETAVLPPCEHQHLKKREDRYSKCINGDFEQSYTIKCLDCREYLSYHECLACVKTQYPSVNI